MGNRQAGGIEKIDAKCPRCGGDTYLRQNGPHIEW
jgi:ribosomal protein S27AE